MGDDTAAGPSEGDRLPGQRDRREDDPGQTDPQGRSVHDCLMLRRTRWERQPDQQATPAMRHHPRGGGSGGSAIKLSMLGFIVGTGLVVACGSTTTTAPPSSTPTEAATATPTPTAVRTPIFVPPPLRFTASGDKQTTTFTTSGTFTISWTATASAGCSNLSVTATVYAKGKNPNSDPPDAGPFDQTGCSLYTTEVNVNAGQYFLNLEVANGTAVYTVTRHPF